MNTKDNKSKYDIEYAKANLKRIPLDVQKDKYEEIKNAAQTADESVNGYIKKAIDERMEHAFSESHPFINPSTTKGCNNMPLPQPKLFTTEDIYGLPDGTRAELIDGQMYMMAPPSRMHQKIVFNLSRKIADFIDSKHGDCETYMAPFAVFLNADDRTYVEPDISIICDKNKLNDKGCVGAPDWIVEVVSPSSKRMDYFIKLFKYRSAGVREYWLVDPAKNSIIVYNFESEDMLECSFTDSVPVGIYEDFSIDFSQLNI